MAMASPEVRKQGDFKLSYDWDNAGLSVGGGISVEDDYESRFGNIGGRFDFNQKQTVLNVDLSYTNSDTNAVLDHDDYTLKNSYAGKSIYQSQTRRIGQRNYSWYTAGLGNPFRTQPGNQQGQSLSVRILTIPVARVI